MTLADSLRRAAQAGRTAAASVAQRLITVTLEVTVYDKPINMAGAVAGTPTVTTITPNPKVEKLGPGDPSWFGGGVDSLSGGDLDAGRYRVGPITRLHLAGGYEPTTLAVAGAATTRVVWRLTGPTNGEFESGGELFDLVQFEKVTPQSVTLVVQRTRQT